MLSGVGTLADKNVAANKTIGVGTLSLANGGSGGLAANYTLSSGTHLLAINRNLAALLTKLTTQQRLLYQLI